MDIDTIFKILQHGGPACVAVFSLIALSILWRYHTKSQEKSTERHQQRDDQFEQLQKESIEVMTKCNTLLEIIISRG